MNKFTEQLKSMVESSPDTKSVCSGIIKYFTQDDSFDDVLSDETTREYKVFNLSIKYLDSSYKDKRDEIGEELGTLLECMEK